MAKTNEVSAEEIKQSLIEEIKSTFYIRYQMDNEDGDSETTEMLEGIIDNHLSKLK